MGSEQHVNRGFVFMLPASVISIALPSPKLVCCSGTALLQYQIYDGAFLPLPWYGGPVCLLIHIFCLHRRLASHTHMSLMQPTICIQPDLLTEFHGWLGRLLRRHAALLWSQP